jgi:hypothetical protein
MTTLLDCGTDWFQMGTSGSFVAERTGRLKMQCNEYLGGLGDNEPPPAAKLWAVSIGGESYGLDSLSETNGPLVVQGQTYSYTASGVVWAGNYHSEECLWDPDGVRTKGGCAPSTPTIAPEGWVAPGLVEVSLVGRIIYSGTVTLSVASPNVFVNADDDNQNGTNDANDALDQVVNSENDLVAVTLSQSGLPGDGTITLTVTPTSAPAGHVRVWRNAERDSQGPLLDNANSTEVSWTVDEMPDTIYLEGVGASSQINDLSLILSAPCSDNSATAHVTVVDVTSVTWAANSISPLISNAGLGGVGGGAAIFPDRPSPMSSPDDYNTVEVKAVIQPPMADITIYFTSLDADDPSANTAPVDDENSTQDNRGTPKTGNFVAGGDSSTIAWPTEPGGTSTVTFITTMQPGDNFRVIASPLADFKNGYEAKQDANDGAVVAKYGDHSSVPGNYTTEMLTVWRHLWIEQDYMDRIPLIDRDIFASVKRKGIFGNGGFVVGPHEFTASSISYGTQYSWDEPGEDEFEGGSLRFRLYGRHNGLPVLLDEYSGFTVLKSPAWNTVIKRFQFWPELSSTQLNRMNASDVTNIHAYFTDDDDYTLFDNPYLVDIGSMGRNAYAEAYIIATNAPSSLNTNASRRWIRHVTHLQFLYGFSGIRDLPTTLDFWSTQIVACHEPTLWIVPFTTNDDYDPDGDCYYSQPPYPGAEPLSDRGACYGLSGSSFGVPKNISLIFLQVIRDQWAPWRNPGTRVVDEQHIATHEIGHTPWRWKPWGLGHSTGLMETFGQDIQDESHFNAGDIDELRTVDEW